MCRTPDGIYYGSTYMSKLSQRAIDALNDKIERLEGVYDELKDIAEKEMDRYWAVFKLRNQSIINAASRGEQTKKVGRLAPRIHKMTDRDSVRLEWIIFDGSPRRTQSSPEKKSTKHFSKTVPQPQRGYSAGTFKRFNCEDWEIEMALESERILSPVRKAMKQIKQEIRSTRFQIKELRSMFEEKENG